MAEYFDIPKVPYEGTDSKNPLSFKHYDAGRRIGGKTMAEHLRFSVAAWHTFCGSGADPFGSPTMVRPWKSPEERIDAAFEFFGKLGVSYYCFHDRDFSPEGADLAETHRNLERLCRHAFDLQKATGVKLLWGTANLFSHPRYMCGAATNPDPVVFAHAASQVKRMLEMTLMLGGENYVFWGGREGYDTLLNTDLKREQEHMAAFLRMSADYAREIGFRGQLLIEPKPKEPTKHQYDYDAATVISFLKTFGLADRFKLNIEANHANLAGHSFHHEIALASAHGLLGSIDANRGDTLLGWDTDQFPNDVAELVSVMMIILDHGGIAPGGLNFDAKVRRASTSLDDLLYAHIGGMDAFALALKIASQMKEDAALSDFIRERYSGYDSGIGKEIETGTTTLERLEGFALQHGEPALKSGRQEKLENLVNQYLFSRKW